MVDPCCARTTLRKRVSMRDMYCIVESGMNVENFKSHACACVCVCVCVGGWVSETYIGMHGSISIEFLQF